MGLLINIDNGGTFTDLCLIDEGKVIQTKTLTTPYDLTKCFIEILEEGAKEKYGKKDVRSLLNETEIIRYSTTAGTNAIVERKGPRLGLLVSTNTDVEELIRNENEREIYDVLVSNRVVYIDSDQSDEELESDLLKSINQLLSVGANRLIISINGSDYKEKETTLKRMILDKYPRHMLGAVPVLLSNELIDDQNYMNRTWAALINSFLHPQMESFLYNAETYLRRHRTKNPMLIFHNDGNSARVAKTTAIKTHGSGPRGGMEGAKAFSKQYNIPSLITLDIGGTTADIGFIENKEIKEKFVGEIEGIPVPLSTSDLISVGAGGSSVIKANNGSITVGPESVGAAPGPASFARGGEEATITDAYLLMGIFDPKTYFSGQLELDVERAKTAIDEKVAKPLNLTTKEAVLAMENAYVQKISEGIKEHIGENIDNNLALLSFGGAGPISACSVANELGIKKVIVPRFSPIFSAFGISFSDVAHQYQTPIIEFSEKFVNNELEILKIQAERDMYAEGFNIEECELIFSYGYMENDEAVYLDINDTKVSSLKNKENPFLMLKVIKEVPHFEFAERQTPEDKEATTQKMRNVLLNNAIEKEIPVYRTSELPVGATASGPAILEDDLSTVYVLEEWTFKLNENKDIFLINEGVQ